MHSFYKQAEHHIPFLTKRHYLVAWIKLNFTRELLTLTVLVQIFLASFQL